MEFIDLKTQYERYKSEIDARIHSVLDHGKFIMGPEINELESALAKFVGVRHAITVASGTASLEIALRALGVGYGDEVITVPFTWISTAEVISLIKAKPIFVDIKADDFNIDIDQMEAAITPKTKAIIPVSLFGQMPNYERINAIASKHGVPVIEDGAQSFGATQNGRRSCSVTTIGSTSFFPAKPLGCFGDGGALFTNDEELANRMRAIRNHGGIVRHNHTHEGTNGRFDTIQAAVLLAKLPHFNWEVGRRNEIGARYTNLLDQAVKEGFHLKTIHSSKLNCKKGEILPPRCMPGNTHVYAQYTIRVKEREEVGSKLKEKGIPSAIYYPKCLHEQPVFADCGNRYGDFPVAEQAAREVISLPMHPFLSEEQQEMIVRVLCEI